MAAVSGKLLPRKIADTPKAYCKRPWSRWADTYLLNYFIHKNIPKDTKQYNKHLNDETLYNKYYDFTYNNKRDVSGILKTIKTKYKQLKLRSYEINFDKTNLTKYDIHGFGWWKFSIYDNNNIYICIQLNMVLLELNIKISRQSLTQKKS